MSSYIVYEVRVTGMPSVFYVHHHLLSSLSSKMNSFEVRERARGCKAAVDLSSVLGRYASTYNKL